MGIVRIKNMACPSFGKLKLLFYHNGNVTVDRSVGIRTPVLGVTRPRYSRPVNFAERRTCHVLRCIIWINIMSAL